jgi:hypothetical protein
MDNKAAVHNKTQNTTNRPNAPIIINRDIGNDGDHESNQASGKITLTAENCLADSNGDDFTDKLLVVKADALMPEYRDTKSQLVRCTHGNGARPNALGRSIFCKELASGNIVVYYRHEIEGVADTDRLPKWAKAKLVKKQAAKKLNHPDKKPSLLGRLEEAKKEAAAHNAERTDAHRTKKHSEMEV